MRKLITLAAAAFTAAALALGGASAASASAHPQAITGATLTCGFACNDLSSLITGPNKIQNANNDGWINLRSSGVLRENEDFIAGTVTEVGELGEPGTACGSGLLAPASIFCVSTTYAGDSVYEEQSAPDGNSTDRCVGLRAADISARVVLIPCGTALSTWVADSANGVEVHGQSYTPWLNGSDSSDSNAGALALTVNTASRNPGDVLRANVEQVSAGFVPDIQQFAITFGPVSGPMRKAGA
jgi:hypothetical protein